MPQNSDLIRNLKTAIAQKNKLKKELHNLTHQIETKKHKLMNLYTVIKYDDAVTMSPIATQRPAILVGNAQHRMSIVCLGKLPQINHDLYHTPDVIYPPGYVMRRRFKSHKFYTRKPGRIFYTGRVVGYPEMFEISTNDGYTWAGPNVWTDFVKSFDEPVCEYRSVEDFFGLSHPSVQKFIEDLGDLTPFKKYIPLKNRRNHFRYSRKR